jgi:hypothetical protein
MPREVRTFKFLGVRMQEHKRYRVQGEPLSMKMRDCSCAKSTIQPSEEVARRRRPPSLAEMNRIAREFWSRKENQP